MFHPFSSNMAEIKAGIFLLFILSLFQIPKAASKSAGFGLKLNHSYTRKSLNGRNTTFLEIYKSYVRAIEARASYWTLFNTSTANKTIYPDANIQPLLTKENNDLVVALSIGTPPQPVWLVFDTGSSVSWTQSAYCTTCFPQSTPKYDHTLSTSFVQMSGRNPDCKPPIYIREQMCKYKIRYIDGGYSNGFVFFDVLASMDDNNPDIFTPRVHFGCSLETGNLNFADDTMISGILGMSRTEESLPSIFNQHYGISRFSYCIIDRSTPTDAVNWVTFGNDIPDPQRQNLKKVPFIEHTYSHAWAVNLIDISVGNERLNLPPRIFAPIPDGGSGGLVMDTGSTYTMITREAYLAIKSKIMDHFSKIWYFSQIPSDKDLCYFYYFRPTGPLPVEDLLSVTFHLENGVALVLPPTNVYIHKPDSPSFCLGIWEGQSNWPNIFGAMQQQETRFIYDLNDNSLSFAPEHCPRNQG